MIRSIRAWVFCLVERVLNCICVRLFKWSNAISEAADTVGGKV